MTSLIWLASYPKSGSTWVRMILANLGRRDAPADINVPVANFRISSARDRFDDATLLCSGLLTHDEVDRLRPGVFRSSASGPEAAGAQFAKVHDGYRYMAGEPLLGGRQVAAAAIVIVRDPRDVAVSFAHHLGCSPDAAIAAMADAHFALCDTVGGQAAQLRQRLGSWSAHVSSWLDQRDIPFALLRYEDLLADPVAAFEAAMTASGQIVTRADIEQAVGFAGLDELRRQEREHGFYEASPTANAVFFREGRSGGWRRLLSDAQIQRIEQDHGATMTLLGYKVGMEKAGG